MWGRAFVNAGSSWHLAEKIVRPVSPVRSHAARDGGPHSRTQSDAARRSRPQSDAKKICGIFVICGICQ